MIINPGSNREIAREVLIQDRMRETVERVAQRALRREMNRMIAASVRLIRSGQPIDAIDNLAMDHEKNLAKILRRSYSAVMDRMQLHVAQDFKGKGFSPSFQLKSLDNPEENPQNVNELVQQFFGVRVFEQVKKIKTTTLRLIEDAGREGAGLRPLPAGISVDDLGTGQAAIAKRILQMRPLISDARARLIARTETHTAQQAANHEMVIGEANRVGLRVMKRWAANLDDRLRESHEETDGQVVAPSQLFVTGMGNQLAFPGDPDGPAKEIINCRCVIVWETE